MFLAAEEDAGPDPGAVLAALANRWDREILAMAQREPIAAKTVLERTDIPKSTLYRRVNHLQEEGLLVVVRSTIEDGHRIDRYRCPLAKASLTIEGGEVRLERQLAASVEAPSTS